MDAMGAIHLRGICSNYFETHVSPVLMYIQQSQLRLDKRMDDLAQKLQISNDSLDRKPPFDISNDSLERKPLYPPNTALSTPRGDGMSVPVLSRLQELSTLVHKKADASEISRLSALVEKATVCRKKSDVAANVNMESFSTLVDQKLECFREPMLKQIEDVSARVQTLVAALENKAESKDIPTLEQWQILEKDVQTSSTSAKQIEEVAAQLETLIAALTNKAESKHVPTLEQWERLEKDVQALSSSVKQIDEVEYTLEQWDARVDILVAAIESKAESKDVPTLDQWKKIEKDVQASSSSSSNPTGEKSELKKVQMLVAAAGARFDRQLKELRQQLREVKERTACEQVDGSQVEDPRWPGRVIRASSDDEVDSAYGRAPSISESLAGSVTGLGPEERAELQKIQAVVGAAGTAFSKEIRELKKQFKVLSGELIGLKEHVNNSKPRVAGA